MYDFDRRSFIKIGSIAAFHWLTLGDALKAQAETKKGDDISVIHLFLTGGMSQMDTFDPKPNSKPEYRSQVQTHSDQRSRHSCHRTSSALGKTRAQVHHHPLDDAQNAGPCAGLRLDSQRPPAAVEYHASVCRIGREQRTGAAQ